MAWNRPSGDAERVALQGRARNRFAVRNASIGVVVALGVVLVAWFLWTSGSGSSSSSEGLRDKTIREVKPHLRESEAAKDATNREDVTTSPPITNVVKQVQEDFSKYKYYRGEVYTAQLVRAQTIEERLFHHSAERHIAVLLNTEPGTEMVGEFEYGKDFLWSFKKSLVEPIVVSKTDTPEEKALKRAVNETKIDLKAKLDAGEDICKIMNDSRKDLQQLGLYREELRQEISRLGSDKTLTTEDLETFVDAANKMLAERGGKPLSMPGFLKHRILMKQSAKQDKDKASK